MSLDMTPSSSPTTDHGDHAAAIAARASGTTDAHRDHVATAYRLYRERRARLQAFSQSFSIFGEPGWDILLEIYLADTVGRAMCVGTACLAADVAQTTGLRWLAKLEKIGLVLRQDDPTDGRRGLVMLTPRGRTEMDRYLSRIAEGED
jgi:DNA-binding MarR family transcriptional regulator